VRRCCTAASAPAPLPCVRVCVRTGRDASGDTWEPLERLTNCKEAIAAFQRETGRTLPRRIGPHRARRSPPALPPPPLPPAGFNVDAAPSSELGAALVGRQLIYRWPDDGWQRGTVARLCPRPAFSHVAAYTRQTSAPRGAADSLSLSLSLRGTADSLLDSASYTARGVLLSPAAAAGVRGHSRPPP
jgi:hypothetical protein